MASSGSSNSSSYVYSSSKNESSQSSFSYSALVGSKKTPMPVRRPNAPSVELPIFSLGDDQGYCIENATGQSYLDIINQYMTQDLNAFIQERVNETEESATNYSEYLVDETGAIIGRLVISENDTAEVGERSSAAGTSSLLIEDDVNQISIATTIRTIESDDIATVSEQSEALVKVEHDLESNHISNKEDYEKTYVEEEVNSIKSSEIINSLEEFISNSSKTTIDNSEISIAESSRELSESYSDVVEEKLQRSSVLVDERFDSIENSSSNIIEKYTSGSNLRTESHTSLIHDELLERSESSAIYTEKASSYSEKKVLDESVNHQ